LLQLLRQGDRLRAGAQRAEGVAVEPLRPALRIGLEAPEEGGERTCLGDQLDGAGGIVDGRFDLAAMADDAGIAEEPLDVPFAEARHLPGFEPGEGSAKILPFAEDRQPGKAGLESLEADLFEEPDVVVDRAAPFTVMIGAVVFRAAAPEAARL